jgi:tRNA A-37 threonylcarbamoyl transferase component Bud32
VQEPGSTKPTEELSTCARCGGTHGVGESCAAPGLTLAFAGDASAPRAPTPRPEPAAPGTTAATDPLIGSRVGSFDVVRLLGRGGMGTVYLAEHPVIGSRVAVKFLHESMASDPAVVARFYDEARAVNLIGHENIVGIYDLSMLPPNRYFFVMEYLEGETLQALLRAGPVEPAVARDILLQTCDALQCAHEHGVVHRDLKPDNVFLVQRHGKAHFVKLVDFGIAKLRVKGATGGRTQSGFIVGTPEYMAPEQCEDGPIDARTDVYALGVMAFELATGRLPFEGKSVPQLLLAHLREAPPKPSSLAQVPAELEATILRALEKDPARRFQDMTSFAAALRAVPLGAPRVVTETVPAIAPAPPPPPAPVVAADLLVAGAAPQRLGVVELTRGGIFLRAERNLPPLRSRVRLALAHPALRARLEVEGEVVRHVSPAEAAAWHTSPGFALQFTGATPEVRAALGALADELRPDAPPPAPPSRAEVDARLALLEARRGDTHYAFLALPPDAEFAEIRRAVRGAREELEGIRARPLAPEHPARATALLARVEAAQDALGAPAARLAYDARHGNAGGVARCVAAGVPASLVEARRRELLAERPGRAAEAQRLLARAEVARKLGNAAAAGQAYEAALAADPLDLSIHEAYAAFRRRAGGG